MVQANIEKLLSNVVGTVPIFGKILERLMFNEMFRSFSKNKQFFQISLVLKPGDSCTSQLLFITHEIHKCRSCKL